MEDDPMMWWEQQGRQQFMEVIETLEKQKESAENERSKKAE